MGKLKLSALLVGAALFLGLGATSLSAEGMKCGAGKCGGASKKEKPAAKCGGASKNEKSAAKCGAGKCGSTPKKDNKQAAAKCGAGKCGSK